MTETTRRAVMFGAGGAGLAAVLTACASYGSPAAEPAPDTADLAEEPDGEESAAAPKKKKPKALADTSDIPSGEGKIFKNQDVVITQPSEGEFRAFSATCTHQGCAVASVSNGVINCPCHGSQFSIEDGSVVQGPAGEPLAEKKISVSGGKIRLA
ncbi:MULTISPECIES: Rieske (2Fe-2S) protein [Nonomuraea]|uniref:Cytochrome bc1 complex Rieske iron-sulfur subunit n=2 Tax=Nonomuraea TaxID=83681 RepID=A0ABW1C5D6_9ACTN|nr:MULTISPECIES: Rieske (2Fe-2S) protein [Nonomuraea]MDA0640316.1 Rieske (2Fe-2S) protein [Nonomuraea ferruginea]TXK40446.1 Rieske (2Fe-2S) protein [Nonomuraea sp. C10]